MQIMDIKKLYKKQWLMEYSTEEFEEKYYYNGNDLGANWTKNSTTFKVWSPFANAINVNLYESGTEGADDRITSIPMKINDKGVWVCQENGDISNVYYTYEVFFGDTHYESCDPYAKAVGVNGNRAMVVNLFDTNPIGWENDKNPNINKEINDSIIYELHVRDFSSDTSSGIKNKGKFLGLIEDGIKIKVSNTEKNIKTGINYFKELGITHLHLLPFYDYGSIDESIPYDCDKYNWGYDPINYNVPEGSYSTDSFNGKTRISELKETILTLHREGISVIMDVVYNHTYNEDFCFNKIVPGYFHRISDDGVLSNGSACGNDTASERAMVSKYIVDSVLYWAKEYHIDGFRFDLLGLIDTETMIKIRIELEKLRPDIILYGEGWTLNTKLTKENISLATQKNINQLNNIAMFSDDLRDAIKGSVFEKEEKGFISGNKEYVEDIKRGILGVPVWSDSPLKVINYTSCHDNYTLFDKIYMCNHNISFIERVKQNKLAIGIVMLSQGTPLIHAGEEILRSKVLENGEFVSDSVRESDKVNSIKYSDLEKVEYYNVFSYYRGLIEFRKNNRLLHLKDKEEVNKKIEFTNTDSIKNDLLIVFTIKDDEQELIGIINGSEIDEVVNLENGVKYNCYIDGNSAGNRILYQEEGNVCVPSKTIKVLKKM